METSGGVVATRFLIGGRVGADVTSVVFAAQDTEVRATVRDGCFTAWWPQRKPATLYGRLVDDNGWNGSPNPGVTLRSGKTKPIRAYDVNH